MTAPSPALNLILLSIRPVPDAAAIAEAAARLDAAEWDDTRRLARRHGVLPLLARGLSSAGVALREPVQKAVRKAAARNLALTAELRRVAAAMHAGGLSFLSLKGPAEGLLAYGDAALRSGTDLDLAVAPDARWTAVEILGQLGYRLKSGDSLDDPGDLGQVALLQDQSGTMIDLHWRLSVHAASFPLPVETALSRSRRVALDGVALPMPGDADRFLYLCMHGTLHRWEKLSWLCDLAWEWQRLAPDWTAIERQAAAMGIRRILHLSQAVLHDLLAPGNLPQPRPLPLGLVLTASWIRRHLAEPPGPGEIPWIIWLLLRLACQDTWRQRVNELLRLGRRRLPGTGPDTRC